MGHPRSRIHNRGWLAPGRPARLVNGFSEASTHTDGLDKACVLETIALVEDKGAPTREFSEDERKHLDFIQATISRLAGNSASTKTGTVLIGLAGFGLSRAAEKSSITLAAVLVVAVLGVLDAQYLRQERLFRKLYEAVSSTEPSDCIPVYSMGTGGFKYVTTCRLRSCVWSWSVAGFYGVLIVLGVAAFITGLYTPPT